MVDTQVWFYNHQKTPEIDKLEIKCSAYLSEVKTVLIGGKEVVKSMEGNVILQGNYFESLLDVVPHFTIILFNYITTLKSKYI